MEPFEIPAGVTFSNASPDMSTGEDVLEIPEGVTFSQPAPPKEPIYSGYGVTGVLGDVARGAYGGLQKGVGMLERGGQWLAPEGSGAEKFFKRLGDMNNFYQQTYPELFQESKASQRARAKSAWDVRGWVYPAAESVAMMAPGITAGMVAGPEALAALVGVQYGAGTAQQAYDQISQQRPEATEQEKLTYALEKGAWEGGLEIVQDLIPFGIAKAIPKAARGNIVKAFAGAPAKDIWEAAKRVLVPLLEAPAAEVPMELTQEWLGQATDYQHGMSDKMPTAKSIAPVIGPTVLASVFIQGAVGMQSSAQKKQIAHALSDPSVPKEYRDAAVEAVYHGVKEHDKTMADEWKRLATPLLEGGKPIIARDDAFYSRIAEERGQLDTIQTPATAANPEPKIREDEYQGYQPEAPQGAEPRDPADGGKGVPWPAMAPGEYQRREANANMDSLYQGESPTPPSPVESRRAVDDAAYRDYTPEAPRDFTAPQPTPRPALMLPSVGEHRYSTEALLDNLDEVPVNRTQDGATIRRPAAPSQAVTADKVQSPKVQDSQVFKSEKWANLKLRRGKESGAYDSDYRVIPVRGGYQIVRGISPDARLNRIPAEISPAIAKMESDLKAGEVGGVARNEQGDAKRYVSTNPAWFKRDTLEAYDKQHGTTYAKDVNKFSVLTTIKKMREGKELTGRQQRVWDYLQDTAGRLNNEDQELSTGTDAAAMERRGFEPAFKKTTAGDLEKGDKFIGKVGDSQTDEFEHKGFDAQGNAILQDGVRMEVDPFEPVQIDGIKKAKKKAYGVHEPIKPDQLVNGVTRKTLGEIIASGDVREAVRHVKEGLESGDHTLPEMQDAVRNEILRQVAAVPKAERDAMRGRVAPVEAALNEVLSKTPGRETALPANKAVEEGHRPLSIAPLSEHSFIVRGDAGEIRQAIPDAKGVYNHKRGGMVYANKNLEAVERAIKEAVADYDDRKRSGRQVSRSGEPPISSLTFHRFGKGNVSVPVGELQSYIHEDLGIWNQVSILPEGIAISVQTHQSANTLRKLFSDYNVVTAQKPGSIGQMLVVMPKMSTGGGGTALLDHQETSGDGKRPSHDNNSAAAVATSKLDQEAHQAATSPTNGIPEPTEAQQEAGNYQKGHVKLNGFDISIENPAGSERKGTDKGGKSWSVTMKHHYGYLRGTIGKDKDHIDVFIGDHPESQKVYVVDQVNKDGAFGEHKVLMGFDSEPEARAGYLANYEKGWQGLGAITEMSVDEFKDWAAGDTAKPVSDDIKQQSNKETSPKQGVVGQTAQEGDLQSNKTDKGVALYSKAGRYGSDRSGWQGFPDVVINSPLGTASKHADYDAAKSGDKAAALRLAMDLVDDATTEKIRRKIGDRKPVVVPVLSEEEEGRNQLPAAYAAVLAERLGLEVDPDIVQSVRAHHTGAKAFERIARQPVFDGRVDPGQDYIIVDDTLAMGGTLANLRGHIERNGGRVVLASVLTGHDGGANIVVSEKFKKELREKFGEDLEEYLQDEFGFGIDHLTNGEAGHIRKALSIDSLRDTISAARVRRESGLDEGHHSRLQVAKTGTTTAQVESEARAFLRRGYDNLPLNIVQNEDELPGEAKKAGLRSVVHRFYNQLSPMSDWGHAMFADNIEQVRGYGKQHYFTDPEMFGEMAIYAGSEKFRDAMRRYYTEGSGVLQVEELEAAGVKDGDRGEIIEQLLDDANPSHIVDSAQLWDSEDISGVWDEVLNPNGWLVVETSDGAIVFDESLISRGDEESILYSKNGRIIGLYKDGTIHLVADALKPGDTEWAMRHEGLHYLLRNDKAFSSKREQVLADFEKRRKLNPAVRAAFAKVPEDTAPENVTEEALAYYLQDSKNAKQSLFKKMVATVKAWLIRHGIPLKNWTLDDVQALVVQSLRSPTVKENLTVGTAKDSSGVALKSKAAEAAEYIEEAGGGDGDKAINKTMVDESVDILKGMVKHKTYKRDTNIVERWLSTLEHYGRKIPAVDRYMEAALSRTDKKFAEESAIMGVGADGDVVRSLSRLQKTDKAGYADLKKILLDADRNHAGWGVRADDGGTWSVLNAQGKAVLDGLPEDVAITKMIEGGAQDLRTAGHKENVVQAWMDTRAALNRGFDRLAAQMRKLEEDARTNDQAPPKIRATASAPFGVYDSNSGMVFRFFESKADAQRFIEIERQARATVSELAGLSKSQKQLITNADWTVKKFQPGKDKADISLSLALSHMGDLRGTYFPRQRPPGAFAIVATKDGADSVREHFDAYAYPNLGENPDGKKLAWIKEKFNLATPIGRRARQLERLGYDVTIQKDESISEDVFDAAKLAMSVEAVLDKATEKDHGEIDNELNKAVIGQVADIFKGRGFRASMIKRADTYWTGFEEDPLKAVTQYAKGMAAGIAKRDAAREMVLAITGRDISWSDWKKDHGGKKAKWDDYLEMVKKRRLDPATQKNAYNDVMHHMQHVLRNEELHDRILGQVKGLAVLKFLGFRVSSAAVNVTNMAMAVPAVMNSEANIPYLKTWKHIGQAATDYGKWRTGAKIPVADRAVFEEISKRGWDQEQFNAEAYRAIRGKFGNTYDSLMKYAMFMFGATERFNRAATIYGTYKGIMAENPKMGMDEAMGLAKKVSDKAHGVYGKATLPYAAQGKGPGQTMLRAAYTFQKFSHNYLLTMLDMGVSKGEWAALSHMLLAPAVLAGAGASVATPIIAALAKALGGGDDPEEDFYKWANKAFGGGEWMRHGLAGLGGAGVNLKGSLQINFAVPTTLNELLGAPAGVFTDEYRGIQDITKGDVAKGFEKVLPTGISAPIKALREYNEGVTTGSNMPIYYGAEPLKGTGADAVMRFFSFNPSNLSAKREQQWREKRVAQDYSAMRTEIYGRIRRYYLGSTRTRADWAEILAMVKEYNVRAAQRGLPLITPAKIKGAVKRMHRAPKRERERERAA